VATSPPKNFTPHTLVQVGGTVLTTGMAGGVPGDAWSVGLRCGDVDGTHGPVNDPDAMLDQVVFWLKQWFLSEGITVTHPENTIDWVKVNNIAANGHYSDPDNPRRVDLTPVLAPTPSGSLDPGFVTLVGTFHTAKLRGRASSGRMYWPLQIHSNSSDQVPTSLAATTAGVYRHILQVMSGIVATTGVWPPTEIGTRMAIPGIYSGIDASRNWITSTAVGVRKDSQRRRKNAIPENYQGSEYTPTPPTD
jgi:hypothetical protein